MIVEILAASAAIVTIIVVGYRAGRWAQRIEGRLDALEFATWILIALHAKEIMAWYEKAVGLSASRKKELIEKLEAGTISPDEIAEFRGILEKEKAEAIRAGNTAALLAIGAMLCLLSATLAIRTGVLERKMR